MEDWDGVEPGPEVAEQSLVPARGKWKRNVRHCTYCCTHNTHEYCVLTDRCD